MNNINNLEKLIFQIREGNVVVFAGAGLSFYAGAPSGKELIDKLKLTLPQQNKEELKNTNLLHDFTQRFVEIHSKSRNKLNRILQNEIGKTYDNVKFHTILSDIPQINQIITTNYDQLFEQAYDYDLNIIINRKSITSINPNKKVLYKIHGDIKHLESIIITSSDYNSFFNNLEDNPIWTEVRSIINKYSIFFIGYSFDDSNIRFLYDKLIESLGEFVNESFLVAPDLPLFKQSYLAKKHIAYINSTAENILPFIHEEIHKHLLEDTVSKKIDINKSTEALLKKGINPQITINTNGIFYNNFQA